MERFLIWTGIIFWVAIIAIVLMVLWCLIVELYQESKKTPEEKKADERRWQIATRTEGSDD